MKFTGERMIPEDNSGSKIYFEHMNRYIFSKQFVKGKDILDIACGSGYGTDALLSAGAKSVLGVDISKEAVDYCKDKYPQGNFAVGSVDAIPIGDASVDVIVSFETIEHVDEEAQEKFMQEVNRVLREDGVFVLSTPNALVYEKGNEFHVKELTPDELDGLLKKHGFEYEIFFQESVDSNYIFSNTEIEKGHIKEKGLVIFENEEKRTPWEARYLIVVCTKKKEKVDVVSSVYVSNIQSIRHAVSPIIENGELIVEKDSKIALMDNELSLKNAEIELMKASKFWKLRSIYIKIKKLLLK